MLTPLTIITYIQYSKSPSWSQPRISLFLGIFWLVFHFPKSRDQMYGCSLSGICYFLRLQMPWHAKAAACLLDPTVPRIFQARVLHLEPLDV